MAESVNDLANSQFKAFSKQFQVHTVAISMHGTTTVEHTFCELEKVLSKNEVILYKLVCSVTDGSLAGTRFKNGTLGKRMKNVKAKI